MYSEFRHNLEQQTWLVRKPLWWCSTVLRVSGRMLGVARLLEIAWAWATRTLYMGRTRGSRKKPADPIKNIVRLGSVYNAVSSTYNSEAPNSFYIETNKLQGPSLPEVTLNLWLTNWWKAGRRKPGSLPIEQGNRQQTVSWAEPDLKTQIMYKLCVLDTKG